MDLSHENIVEYYGMLPRQGGYDSRCEMYVPGGIDRAIVIDLACRRGKGTYKLSDYVGPLGQVYGIDWDGNMIETAREGEAAAIAKNGLDKSNIEFFVSYPEELIHAGIMEESVDVVYINSVFNLLYSPEETLKQIGMLLRTAGTLYLQTVLATMPRDEAIVEEARRIGNAVQAAPYRKDLARWLHNAGFDMPSFDIVESAPIKADAGVEEGALVEVVVSDEEVFFNSCVIRIDKLGGFDYQELIRKDIAEFR